MSVISQSVTFNQPDVFPIVNPANPLSRGLLASFPMVVGGRMYDASANKRHGNQIDFTNVSWSSSSNGSRLKLDGSQTNGSASWGDVQWVRNLGAITFELEFAINNASTGGNILTKWGTGGPDNSFIVGCGTSGTMQFVIKADAVYTWQTATSLISSNTNNHVVCTWAGGTNAKVYVNGIERTYTTAPGSVTGSIRTSNYDFQIARRNDLAGPACSVGMVNVWNRALTNAEAYSRYINRWGLFAAPRGVSVTVSSITYTYARPTSDITTQWSTSSGSTHYTLIDETVADDNDYIVATAAGQTDEVKLQSMTPPQVGTDLVINYKVTGVDGGATVTVSLRQGSAGTLIKTDTAKSANGTYALTVTPADWAAVTDWSDLRLRFVSA